MAVAVVVAAQPTKPSTTRRATLTMARWDMGLLETSPEPKAALQLLVQPFSRQAALGRPSYFAISPQRLVGMKP